MATPYASKNIQYIQKNFKRENTVSIIKTEKTKQKCKKMYHPPPINSPNRKKTREIEAGGRRVNQRSRERNETHGGK
jgi:hypothetical protein